MTIYFIKSLQLELTNNTRQILTDSEIEQLLTHFGSTNPLLRDTIFHPLCSKLITANILTRQQKRTLTKRLLTKDYLFKNISLHASDAIFQRIDSLVMLNQLIANDNTVANFLLSDQLEDTATALIKYMSEETDYRGFIFEGGKGMALFYVTLAELLTTSIQHPQLSDSTKYELVKHFFKIYSQRSHHFIYNEEQALANTILTFTNIIPSMEVNIITDIAQWHPETLFTSAEHVASFYNKKRLEQALMAHNQHLSIRLNT
ncbi:DUF2785 domain-containing protein [Brochothrix campestris]|uniref:Uncharacterized protein n=1 Tax=Brochothrix campestris FSL F6-1037 TaxID=1265861 RepID=W7D6P6_9LIST|nr:DUF2785 domain-containing protein [Brochothrix campestris]EUJ40968.1 hypothetical protein BCAMP_04210 [Brochothrix campestris FSL F6-1037]